jgi:hypothetical protein
MIVSESRTNAFDSKAFINHLFEDVLRLKERKMVVRYSGSLASDVISIFQHNQHHIREHLHLKVISDEMVHGTYRSIVVEWTKRDSCSYWEKMYWFLVRWFTK